MRQYMISLICLLLLAPASAKAGTSPIGFALAGPVELPPESITVTGVRLSVLWGQHRSVYGFDFGLVGNTTTQNSGTVASLSGAFNWNGGNTTVIGLQGAGLVNINKGKSLIYGLQAAGLMNVNSVESWVTGFQIAALSNYAPHTSVTGVQLSLYNRARTVYGFQIGLINETENLHGIQLGLLNFNRNGPFSIAPILNIGF